MVDITIALKNHAQWPAVEAIYHRLQAQGYRAFLAGGCVRDALLGVSPNDLDIATDATPEQIEEIFEKTVNVGKSFGVMRVLISGQDIEVATFRKDGLYLDGRRPQKIDYASPLEDAQRRDFTVNALFYDLSARNILDYVQGQEDLKKRLLRAVGEPQRRFEEDHLRILRGARFVAQLGFELEESTQQALSELAPLVKTVSGERVRDEMLKLLLLPRPEAVRAGLECMVKVGLMDVLFPFRKRSAEWGASKALPHSWQALSYFFEEIPGAQLKGSMQNLRLSNEEQKRIAQVLEVWRDPEAFFSDSLGNQILRLAQPATMWALEMKGYQDRESLQAWKAWGEVLPEPFLRGEDVLGLQGRAIGDCLSAAYSAQLERQLCSREEALLWLKKYLQKESL